jgi:hypothetical protein
VRTVQLPSAVDASKIEASCDSGVLVLTLPKTSESHAHEIPIKGGKGEPKAEAQRKEAETTEAAPKAEAAPQPH